MATVSEIFLTLYRKAAEAGWAVALNTDDGKTRLGITRQDGSESEASDYATAIALLDELDRDPEPVPVRIALNMTNHMSARCGKCAASLIATSLAAWPDKESRRVRCGNCGQAWVLPWIPMAIEYKGE